MSYQDESVATVIAAYRSQKQPYTNYLRNLAALAVQLKNLKDDAWALEEELCEHYVYVLMDPRKPGTWRYSLPSGRDVVFPYMPFYVGKGKGDRSKVHSRDSVIEKHSYKSRTIRSIRRSGLKEIVRHSKDMSFISDWLAQAYEIDLIAGIGRVSTQEGPLANLAAGGGIGTSGYVFSTQQRALISTRTKGVRKPGTSAARKGVPWTEARRKAQQNRTKEQRALTANRFRSTVQRKFNWDVSFS